MPLFLRFSRDTAFKQQLNVAVTVGVIFFAIASSLLTSWQGSHQIRRTMLGQGERIAENLASQSALALLYDSAENASEAARTALSFPDVTRVEIRQTSGRPLLVRGTTVVAANDAPLADMTIRHGYLEMETDEAWRFVAPVMSRGGDSPFEVVERREETLGFVRIEQSKATLSRLLVQVFFINLIVSFLFASAFLFAIRKLAARMTRPITELSEAMARAEHGDADVRAKIAGPKDIRDMAHAFNSMIGALQDREKALRESEARYRVLVEQAPDAITLYDMDTERFVDCNPAAEKLFGCGRAELLTAGPERFYPADQFNGQTAAAVVKTAAERALAGEQVYFERSVRNAQGQNLVCEVRLVHMPAENRRLIRSSLIDVTDRKLADEQIRQLAFFDALTELPNRRLLMDRLGQALIASNRTQEFGALIILDLDNFKALNDTQGHDIGDRLLVEVGRRIGASVRQEDTVARLGGDEYVVMVEGLGLDETSAARQTEMIAEKIRLALTQPYAVSRDGQQHYSTPSMGLTLFRGLDVSLDILLKQADVALYQAKGAGRNAIRFFNPAMQEAIESRSAMEVALRNGLQQGEFRLFYQPQMERDGRLAGAEALLRWLPANQPPVSPARFIPLAEDTGLILPIGLWVMQTACAQLRSWAENPRTRELQIAINVSARQFRQPDFVEQVEACLEHSGANPTLLKLELTEGVVLENVEEVIARMLQIKKLGVMFSLDDFGTGFSSLSYLKRLPLDQVKIDQSFVRDIAVDLNDAAIVRAIIAMSQSLGLRVIAEGVETEAQRSFLHDSGCTSYQGYLYGKPMPIEEWDRILSPEKPEPNVIPA